MAEEHGQHGIEKREAGALVRIDSIDGLYRLRCEGKSTDMVMGRGVRKFKCEMKMAESIFYLLSSSSIFCKMARL